MMTRRFIHTALPIVLLCGLLTSCVTETLSKAPSTQRKLFGARLKQGDIKIETMLSTSSPGRLQKSALQENQSKNSSSNVELVFSSEATLSAQLQSLTPGFYQLSIAHTAKCPQLNTFIEPSLSRDESDSFYVAEEKPLSIIRQIRLAPHAKPLGSVAILSRMDEKKQSIIGCAAIKSAVIK